MNYTYAGRYGAEQVIDSAGTPLPSTAVTVYLTGTNTPATLYTDRTMATVASNPVSTDSNGNLTFFAVPGAYDLAVGSGARETVMVPIDPSELGAYVPTGRLDWNGTNPAPNANESMVDLIHDFGTTGYLFHMMTGASMGPGCALIGFGVGDNGATTGHAFLVSQKAGHTESAIVLTNAAGTTGQMIYGTHFATGSTIPFVDLHAEAGAGSPVLGVSADAALAAGVALVGNYGDGAAWTGRNWEVRRSPLGTLDHGVDIDAISGSNVGPVSWRTYSGTPPLFWSNRISNSGAPANLAFQASIGAAAIGSETWLTCLEVGPVSGNPGVGFYGTAPVAKPTVTGSKGANAALTSLMTALASLGLVTDSTT